MKKRVFAVILAVLTACGCVLSCSEAGGEVDLAELMDKLCEAGGAVSGALAVIYADEGTAGANDGLRVKSKEDFGFLYDGIFAAPVCYDRIDGYVIRLPLDTSGFEVHIVRCVNLSDTAEVQAMLCRRIEKMKNAEIREYAPENYEICFTGATVEVFGRYVFLISTYDNEEVIREIKRIL